MARADTDFLILEPKGKAVFHELSMMSAAGVLQTPFIQLRRCPSTSSLFSDFIIKRHWILSNAFSVPTENLLVQKLSLPLSFSIPLSQAPRVTLKASWIRNIKNLLKGG